MKTAKEFLEQTDSQYRKDQCRVLKDKYPNIYKSVLVWMNQYAELVKNCDLADVVGRSKQLKAFVDWHNEEYPDNYIPNSRIGRYNQSL